jgi:hypothetical protein
VEEEAGMKAQRSDSLCTQKGKDCSELKGGSMGRRQLYRAGQGQAVQGSMSQAQCISFNTGTTRL